MSYQLSVISSLRKHPTPYTPHPTPYTPHPTPYTPHPTPHLPPRCRGGWGGHTPHPSASGIEA
ncbi:MAG: hypothetical protein DWQ58_08300 [Microcystis aeruginosa TA09]|nr:MAG: hypothetical protein DWQ58_08300 [Microcystis aeruginosa TA09]